MAIEIKVPSLGELVTEATVARWLKQPGDAVALDEPVVELETDKVNVEVPAPAAGTLAEILAGEGMSLPVGAVLGRIGDSAGAAAETAPVVPHPSPSPRAGRGRDPRSGRVRGSKPRRVGHLLATAPIRARLLTAKQRHSNARGRPCASWWRRAGSTPPRLPRPDPATASPRGM